METWQQALAKSITKPEELAKHLDVDPSAIADVVAEYPMRITPMWKNSNVSRCKKGT